jgi:hypothetical protein
MHADCKCDKGYQKKCVNDKKPLSKGLKDSCNGKLVDNDQEDNMARQQLKSKEKSLHLKLGIHAYAWLTVYAP